MRLNFIAYLIAVLALESLFSLFGQTFVDLSKGLPQTVPAGTSLADFDGDGRIDVLCFDATTNWQATLYQNQPGDTFVKVTLPTSGNSAGLTDSFWADDNGDGLLDLLVSSTTPGGSPIAQLFYQNSDHTFVEHPISIDGEPVGWVDLDNDGRIDIIVRSGSAPGPVIYWKEADGSFTQTILPFGTFSGAADLDGDGDLDILLSLNVPILRNDGYRHFSNTGIRLPPGLIIDVDGDGYLDLIANQNAQSSTSLPVIFSNHGDFNFQSNTVFTGSLLNQFAKAADFNGDGLADLFLTAYPRGIGFAPQIILNASNGAFSQSKVSFPNTDFDVRDVEVGDFDGDGDIDLLIITPGLNDLQRRYLRNQSSIQWSLSAPTNLASRTSGDRVDFSWQAGDAKAASFNLRIGTIPGGNDIFASASRPDGRRLLPKMGNVQTAKGWHINHLKPGIYFWSVQAVDWGYRSSLFSSEASFTISEAGPLPEKPLISAIANAFTDEDVPTIASFTIGPADVLETLNLTIESTNSTLTPATSFHLSGTGTNRVLQIDPALNQSGTAFITVRVTDLNGQIATNSFNLTVFPVNDAPVIADIPTQVTYVGAPPLSVPLNFSDVDSIFGRSLQVSAISSEQQFLPDSALVATGPGPGPIPAPKPFSTNVTLGINNVFSRPGSVAITVKVTDGEKEISTSFILAVLAAPLRTTGQTLNGPGQNTVLWADFDNDGRLDVLLTDGWSDPNHSVPQLFWNKPGGFEKSNFVFPSNMNGGAVAADFDRDNYIDLLFVGPDAVHVFHNQNGTNFIAASAGALPKLWFPRFQVADIDNDGDLDLLISGGTDSSANVFRFFVNDGGTFKSASGPLAGFSGDFALADIDNDGWIDLLFTQSLPDFSSTNGVYRGIGGGHFALQPNSSNFDVGVAFGLNDLDGDGALDLWVSRYGILTLYRNENGQFRQTSTIYGTAANPNAWADLDNDGLLDLITMGTNKSAQFIEFHNDGDFSFTSFGNPLFGVPTKSTLSIADINNDGTIDLAASVNSPTGGVRVFTNTASVFNGPPGPPRNLSAKTSDQLLQLSWSFPTDFNQRSGFTYNVRVGSRSGASDILSASALANGKRLLVGIGNAGGRTNLILTNLIAKTCYWSVQAIDNSYAGGPFATEQRIDLELPGNLPPSIEVISTYLGSEDSAGTIDFKLSDDRTLPEELAVRVFANDPSLLPFLNISLSGTGSLRTVHFRPATNAFGETDLLIEAADGAGASVTNAVHLVIANINDAPAISPIASQFSDGANDPITVQFTVSDIDNAAEDLKMKVKSDNSSLLPEENIIFSGTGGDRTAILRTSSSQPGLVHLTFTVTDPDGAASSTEFSVAVTNRIFKLVQASFGGVRSGSMAWGDFDNDGDLDLALAGQGLNQTVIYLNEGGGIFTQTLLGLPNVDGGGVEWGDIDNDGNLDLLIHGRDLGGSDNISSLYHNEGGGRLVPFNSGLTGRYGSAEFGDLDNDGDLDVISTGEPFAVLFENRGGFFFVRTNAFGAAYGAPPILEDFNGDGWLDIHLWKPGDFNSSDSLFTQQFGFFTEQTAAWPGNLLAWNDFDNDGVPDALVSTGTRGSIMLYRNTGVEFVPSGQPILTNFTPDSVSAGDYDYDGFPDLFISGYAGNFDYQTKLFHNEQNGSFREVQTPLQNLMFATASWVDFDNDGHLDLLVNGQSPTGGPYITQLFRNNLIITNSFPAAPDGLRARYTLDGLLIEWNKSVDSKQTNGLTYNVAVGTAPGKWDVLSPQSASDGWRKIPRKGNAGWLTSKLVRGLQHASTYYFTVQAVNASFEGSAFAPEKSILIPSKLPPRFEILHLSGGATVFNLIGESDQPYLIERSDDLQTWTPLGTWQNSSGRFDSVFSIDPFESGLFLRARTL